MADFAVRLQGALVLVCRPGCEVIWMRLAGQGLAWGRRSDFSPTAELNQHRVGLKSDLRQSRASVFSPLPVEGYATAWQATLTSPSPLAGEGLGRGGAAASIGCGVVWYADARYLGREFVPQAGILSFASPKESIQRKGDPKVAPCAARRVEPTTRPSLSGKATKLWGSLRFSKAAAAAELAPALRSGTQTVLADFPAAFCDARRDLREPVRGSAGSLGLGKGWFFVGCNQRVSALHRMAGLSQTSGATRCASIAPCLGFRRSDFSPKWCLFSAAVGLKSDLQSLRWRRVMTWTPPTRNGIEVPK